MIQKLWLGCFLLACAFTAGAQSHYFISNDRRVDIDAFNREVQTMIDDMGVPAVSVAVIENNKVVFANAYGYRRPSEKLKVTRNTVFEACSLSKSYLVFAVHKLVEEGRLDLDKPMYQYLPHPELEHDQRYKLITPRMILAHNTGMENWKQYNNPDTLEILSNPGEKYTYSGEAYNYLAKVVALILGKPYEEYIDELVMRPLDLRNSYVVFKEKKGLFHKESPWNYAYGHDYFGNELHKWKNASAVPSSANNVTAEDYAKLVIATFDKKHLSDQSIRTILQPLTLVRKTEDNTYYYGAGYEVFYVNGDTIIAHGGSNSGFKAEIFYSIPNKRGFVFMSNSDLGRLMSQKFSDLTAGIAIQQYFKNPLEHQYPSTVLSLLKTFRQKDANAMMQEYEQLNAAGKIDIDTRNELAHILMERDTTISMKLLWENYALNKDLPDVNCLLGDAYWEREQWDVALKYFLRAQELNFSLWPIRPSFLQDIRNRIAEDERRKWLSTNIQDSHDTRVEAEDYSSSRGIRLKPSADTGG
ncbi:MAG TPA: serine hydrolase domain-containing protein, partial [Chitinophagaceae bacterium]|nr:serine hydrolase domain-containing protein [Chitinophagaceae bacterium]